MDNCICGHSRDLHRQLFNDDPNPRGECTKYNNSVWRFLGLKCCCQEFELPRHDSVDRWTGRYYWFNPSVREYEHDTNVCRVCNGSLKTARQ